MNDNRRKRIAFLILVGMISILSISSNGEKSFPRLDFSDKEYLLPIDFSILESRAKEENYTRNSYQDSTLQITLEEGRFEDRCDYWVAEITVQDPSQIRTSAARGDFTSKATQDGVKLCSTLQAVLGLNGDFVNGTEKMEFGYIIREGVLYRDHLDMPGRWDSHLMDLLLIDEDGDFHVIRRAKAGDIQDMRTDGKRILNSFCFGPALVMDGKAIEDFEGADTWLNMAKDYERQRIAFCQSGPLHYKVICCRGPYANPNKVKSTGLTLADFTRLVEDQQVETAYNLDGGDSTLLYFHGQRVNDRPNDSARKLQDVIYFVSAEGL
jgi:Exopolysaccharide biosynthesis protein related to N-acetylglucosamine-1-phosphodiester alpha-N-acetylglucosaminidase